MTTEEAKGGVHGEPETRKELQMETARRRLSPRQTRPRPKATKETILLYRDDDVE